MGNLTIRRALAVLIVTSAGVTAIGAQTVEDFVAYTALIFTPAGGLAPTPLRDAGSPSAFQVQYGYMSEPFFEPDESTHRLALGADIRAGAARVGFTLGYIANCGQGQCESTDRAVMLGANATRALFRGAERAGSGGTNWSVGARGSIGYAFPTDDQADFNVMSLAASLPISLTAGTRGQFVPFLVPGVGWGRMSGGGESESGVRFLLGGGLGFASPSGALNVSVGAQKVFIREGSTLFGVQLGWGAPRR
ncbi:MAG TPA: hypothetical protein VFU01_13470 [Gemmatimonadaceae bacterium]|nr:hypothetical protein [Gemmatimonadaceae bacterium]